MIRFSRSIPPVSFRYNRGGRDYQEDSFGILVRDERLLLAISDGMGGHSSGELASRWLVESLKQSFQDNRGFEEIITESLDNTQRRIQDSGKDMGCTAVITMIEKEDPNFRVHYTWVGDSRIYAIARDTEKITGNARRIGSRDNRTLWLVTEDDSFVWGFLAGNELSLDDLTLHPNKNQLELSIHSNRQDIAATAVRRSRSFDLQVGDQIFLCTDGVWETFTHQEEIMNILTAPNPNREMNDHLKRTRKKELLRDNNTFIIAIFCDDMFNVDSYLNKKKIKP